MGAGLGLTRIKLPRPWTNGRSKGDGCARSIDRMKITVKVYGSFRLNRSDYDARKGFVLEMPEGAQVKDILPRLGISTDHGAITTIASKIVSRSHALGHGDEVRIMQLALGG